MTARTLMIQGTASSVGKSIITAALCRLFQQEGLRVAPFKAQNMSLNAAVTPDGAEIGRAQAIQARAARVIPTVDMNPILLKPEGDSRSQVVVLGRAVGTLGAVEYHARKPDLRRVVREALDRLRATHDLVVIEGAGSPAEINLKDRDLVNMFVAEIADAPVILVSDIDRGGVFAALVGTMELLEPHERARVKALLINKFRGDVSLLLSGLDFLEKRTGVPVLGVLPYVQRLRIADEDSASLDARRAQRPRDSGLDVAVIRLPRIANYDDFEPLEHEPGMGLRFVEHADALSGADLVILPGTKSTMADLAWLRETGFADALAARLGRREPVLGICGGCQMLGTAISDPEGIESDARLAEGLGFLPFRTEFGRDKRTAQVRARAPRATFLAEAGAILSGYEIHMGRLVHANDARAAFVVLERNGLADDALDGGVNDDGSAIGTMLHGIFENAAVRSALTAHLRRRKGLPILDTATEPAMDEFDRLAETVRGNVNMDRLRALVGR